MPEAGEAASKSASVNLQTLPLPQPHSMINAGRVQLGDQGASANTDPSLTILVAAYLQRATQIVSQNRKQDQSTYPSLGNRLNTITRSPRITRTKKSLQVFFKKIRRITLCALSGQVQTDRFLIKLLVRGGQPIIFARG